MTGTDDRLLTIGEFSRASGLSPKALRLYDELGLLVPVHVDPRSGYRFYTADQLDDAHVVGWLRRLGMPLARVRAVRDLAAAEAAADVAAFWADVEEQTAARRELAAFLVDHLARKDTTMTASTHRPLELRCAAGSDAGLVRTEQQDVAHADARLLAVADGFGPAGAATSRTALDTLRDAVAAGACDGSAADVVALLQDAVAAADRAVAAASADTAAPDASGTTLTALVVAGARLGLVHVGDSRAYLLRSGGLLRLTHDDSVVQSMVDDGRLTPEEAWSHPERPVLTKALPGNGSAGVEVRLHDVVAGDRYLVCSDGLCAVVPDAAVRRALTDAEDPEAAVAALLDAVRAAGAPDNVAVVVADVG